MDRELRIKVSSSISNTPPNHVAIIMDGNGRWAQARGKPRLFGHQAGARRVREAVKTCGERGIPYLTIFAFSTENWKRTQTEVSGLMTLFKRYIRKEAAELGCETMLFSSESLSSLGFRPNRLKLGLPEI